MFHGCMCCGNAELWLSPCLRCSNSIFRRDSGGILEERVKTQEHHKQNHNSAFPQYMCLWIRATGLPSSWLTLGCWWMAPCLLDPPSPFSHAWIVCSYMLAYARGLFFVERPISRWWKLPEPLKDREASEAPNARGFLMVCNFACCFERTECPVQTLKDGRVRPFAKHPVCTVMKDERACKMLRMCMSTLNDNTYNVKDKRACKLMRMFISMLKQDIARA